MMKVLFDANIIVTFLTQRTDPFLHEIKTLFQLCDEGRISGYVALQSVPIVWYILRKMPDHEKRKGLKFICNLLNLAVTDMASVQRALNNTAFHDFEDNLQDCCAQSVNADYIVTANVGDYYRSVVPALTPKDFMVVLERHRKACSRPAGDVESANVSPNESISLKNADKPVLHRVSIQIIYYHHHHILEFAS